MIKGYVVRWTSVRGYKGQSTIMESLQEATKMHEGLLLWGHHPVAIFAVYADGTEKPLPTYEEALTEHDAFGPALHMAKVDLIAMRDAAMMQVSERDAEIERLRAEHDAERKAWARLVGATAEERDAVACAIADRGRGARSSAEPERAKLEATKQALRTLGIDVDALLAEAAS